MGGSLSGAESIEPVWVVDQNLLLQRRMLDQIAGVEMQIHMPAERLDPLDDPMKLTHVWHATQMLHEIEAHPAKSCRVQPLEVALGERIVRVGDAAITAAALRD